jgi:hypothetical protein
VNAGPRIGALALLAVAVTAGVAAALPVPATRSVQVAADEPQYLLTAISLAEDADLDIADELEAARWRAFHPSPLPEQTRPLTDGRRLSPHDPLLPALLAVPVALGGWVGAKLALAGIAGLLAAVLAWTAMARYRVGAAVAFPVVGMFMLSAPLAVYGTQVYPEMPAALATAVGIAAVTGPLGHPALVALAAAVATLPWLSVKYVPVAATFAGLAVATLLRQRRRRAAALLVASLAAGGLLFVGLHLEVYGGATPYAAGDHFAGGQLTVVGHSPNLVGRSRRLLGLLVDQRFGLAAWQPAWLLIVPAAAALTRRRPPGWVALMLPLAAGWLNATFLALTMHGWWAPGRQVVAVLPAAALMAAWWLEQAAAARPPAGALGLLGVVGYGWMVADGLAGRIDWVSRFHLTTLPWSRPWRMLLPSYMDVSAATWVLHGLWLLLCAGLAVAAWRAVGRQPARPAEGEPVPAFRAL